MAKQRERQNVACPPQHDLNVCVCSGDELAPTSAVVSQQTFKGCGRAEEQSNIVEGALYAMWWVAFGSENRL